MKRTAVMATALLLTLGLAGCSGSDGPGSTPAGSSSQAPYFRLLPKANQESGVITVATVNDLPPWVFLEANTRKGIDIDLTDALGELLGVQFKYSAYEFPAMIPGLQANRFDMVINEIGDTIEREKVVSFVDYSQDFTGIVVRDGNPSGIRSIGDLCGLRVVVGQGSLPETEAKTQSKKCTDAGEKALQISSVPSPTDTYLAVASGRADATLNGYSTAAYAIKQGGVTKGLELADAPAIDSGLNGFAFNKENEALGKAVQAALQHLMDDGTYAQILKKWGVSNTAIPHAWINNQAQFLATASKG